jgi:hypothetical protein
MFGTAMSTKFLIRESDWERTREQEKGLEKEREIENKRIKRTYSSLCD